MNQRASKNSVPPSVGADVSGIETLLTRNLPEVFGEGDPARRRSTIQELYTEDCVLYVPPGTFVGHDALDKFAGDLRATHPHYVYVPLTHRRFCTIRDAWRGDRGRKVKRPPTPVWISSSLGTARSRLFMFTSTRRRHNARAEPCIACQGSPEADNERKSNAGISPPRIYRNVRAWFIEGPQLRSEGQRLPLADSPGSFQAHARYNLN
jgi:hypothetical protein